MDDWEDVGVRWTVRVALALYSVAILIRLRTAREGWLAAARIAWTAGYVMFLIHLAAAFHFVHGWSHAAAYEATARQSLETIGLAWGGGVYANYAFAAIWGLDVGWWWFRPAEYLQRPRWIEWGVQGYLGFIAFNATAVFGQGAIRWVGIGAFAGLAVAAARRRNVG